jgi:hypothetical protein
MQALQAAREDELEDLQRSLQQGAVPEAGLEADLYRVEAGEEEGGRKASSVGNFTDSILRGQGQVGQQVEVRSVDGYQGREKEVHSSVDSLSAYMLAITLTNSVSIAIDR